MQQQQQKAGYSPDLVIICWSAKGHRRYIGQK